MSTTDFESFVIRLTSRFTGLPGTELEDAVRQTLAELVTFLGSGRATLLECQDDSSTLVTAYSASDGSAPPFPEGTSLALPLVQRLIADGVTARWDNLPDDLPPDASAEREFAMRSGFRSNVTVPILVGGRFTAAIASGTFTAHRNWSDADVARVRTVGQLIMGALTRQRAEARLRALSDRLGAENLYLREEIRGPLEFAGIVGKSLALGHVLDQVTLVAGTDAGVLLLGETGTGKELLANAIHERSPRRDQPLVKVNCAAIPAALVESELFGHERGAFTGAVSARLGRFELADGGTLFLDEVGELAPETQAKLLRVLQDGRFERLGSGITRRADVRLIAATNRDLEQTVRAGRFREDLYYRLSAFPIRVPPLRDRREDIPLLVWAFIDRSQTALGRHITRITRATMHALQAYDWPGNVRELENVLERALILSPGNELRLDEMLGHSSGPADQTLAAVERAHIAAVLKQAHGRINGPGGAAELLGLHPNTLRFRMKKLGVRRESRKSQARKAGRPLTRD